MTTRMHIDLRVGETLKMVGADGEPISITLAQKSGQLARLSVQAPKNVDIQRPQQARRKVDP